MCRRAGWMGCGAVLAALATAAAAAEGTTKRTFRIDVSTRQTMKTQDWSGRAEISRGRITQVEKTSGAGDSIHPDMSWTVVYGRSLAGNPKQQPNAKALLISVDVPDDAVLTVKTKGGDFSFRLDEVAEGKQLERLEGEVQISLADSRGAPPGKRGKSKPGRPAAEPAKIAGELPAEAWTDGKLQSDWPALAIAADGTRWCALVEWNGKDRDRVVVIRRPGGGTGEKRIALDDGGGDHYWPAIGMAGDSAVVVWSSRIGGSFGLWWATIAADGTASPPQPLTNTGHTEFQARVAADGRGTLTLVWQSLRNGHGDIYARRFSAGAWGPEVRVSPSAAHDWQPAVALDSRGGAWISWDSYEHGNYDVFLRRFDADGLGPVIPVTSEPTAQFHSSVAVDKQDRVWVAWDDAGPNWGKDLSSSTAAPGYEGLHAVRTIGLRVYANGALSQPAAQPSAAMSGLMTRFAELPQLAVDGEGTLWLVFRHWTIQRPTEMFHVYAMQLTPQGWSTPWRLANSSGQNTQWTSIARRPDGKLAVVYASDGRSPENLPKDQVHALIYAIHQATLGTGGRMPELKLARVDLPPSGATFQPRVRPQMTVEGKTYTLMVGDCHRHTDIRGHSAVDASIMDTFRYAYDPAQLDFMGLGDHNEVFGGRWPDGLRDYQWWWTQKAVDLFTCLPTFVGVYSYEHSMDAPAGHRNILFLKRGAPLRMIDRSKKGDAPDNQPPELWKWVRSEVLTQPGQQCVIVPHTFAAGPLADWNWPNAEFDTLLEIYQGARGSYEQIGLPDAEKRGGSQTKKPGHFAQDALARGNVYGFVCFSDHRSTHTSWACAWVEEVSRASLFQALLARRTYGASDEMVLKVTADGRHVMGERFEASTASPPALAIDVTAPDELRRIDIIKNGVHIYTKNLSGRSFQTVFRDHDAKPGNAYYYVRVLQRDPAAPDGDPQIAWSSPMFVVYH